MKPYARLHNEPDRPPTLARIASAGPWPPSRQMGDALQSTESVVACRGGRPCQIAGYARLLRLPAARSVCPQTNDLVLSI
jgi:hypothetical protein